MLIQENSRLNIRLLPENKKHWWKFWSCLIIYQGLQKKGKIVVFLGDNADLL